MGNFDGYEVNIGEEQLKGAAKYNKYETWDWSDRARGQKVFDHYGLAPLTGESAHHSPKVRIR